MSPITDEQFSNAEILFGSVSCFCCSWVLLTYFIFNDIRKLTFMKLIMYVTVNDFIASLGFAMGSNSTYTFQCTFQAFVTNFNYLSSLFWATVISYQVLQSLTKNAHVPITYWTHCICWGFPLFVTLLPLTTNAYGKTDDESSWCFITDRTDSPSWGILVWDLCSFYIWIWIVVLVNIYFVSNVLYKLKKMEKIDSILRAQVGKLCLYPIAAIICWTPATVTDVVLITAEGSADSGSLFVACRLSDLMAASQGILYPIVFFYVNPSIRKKWHNLLLELYLRYCHCRVTNKVEDTIEDDRKEAGQYAENCNSDPYRMADSMYCLEEGYSFHSNGPGIEMNASISLQNKIQQSSPAVQTTMNSRIDNPLVNESTRRGEELKDSFKSDDKA